MKVGDKVRRVAGDFGNHRMGAIYRIKTIDDCHLRFAGDSFSYDISSYEVVRESSGVKFTNPKDAVASSKIPLWLLSPIAKAHWAIAQAVGVVKYGAWNWREAGVRSSVYLSAIQRHFDCYLDGEDFDPVDGQHNLGAIMACCAILIDAQYNGKLTDDRPPRGFLRGQYADLEKVFAAAIERAKEAGLDPVHITEVNKTKGTNV